MPTAVDLHRQTHHAFNARDWNGVQRLLKDDFTYADHPRNLTLKSAGDFVGWLRGWVEGFSDGTPAEPRYIDGGDYSIALFRAQGTNDGTFGPVTATGNKLDTPFCEILHLGADGKLDRGELYYDNATIMVQMGVMPPQG